MIRKIVKITLIVTTILAALLLIFALAISPIAEDYIEKHSKKLIGRKVVMKDLRLNIFTGTIKLDSIIMYEKNDRDIFASIDTFFVDITLTKLLSSKIEIAQLKVIDPYSVIKQNGKAFNFDDLIPKKDSTKVDKKESKFPKSILIQNIYIKGGELVYTDMLLKHTIKMNDLGVAIPELYFDHGNTNAGINLKIGERALISSKMDMNMKTNEYKLNLKVSELPINIIYPYLKENFNVGKLGGTLNTNLLIAGNTKHILDFKINGTADLTDFDISNSIGEPIASASRTSLKMKTLSLSKATYLFDYIRVSGMNLDFILQPKTNNFEKLIITKQKGSSDTASKSRPITFKIKELRINESKVTYTDKTLRSRFSLPLTNINFECDNFILDSSNRFKADASLPNGGKISFNWKGDFNNLSNQDLMLNLRNLNLKLISPYCLEYLAYDITKGNMNFTSKNKIRNNMISSFNALDVYNPGVGKKHKNFKVEYKIPLKTALYILKDKDGKIKFDIPVQGNIKDPKFSYRKIVFKTLANLMIKVAISPVRFLANILGLNSDKMEEIYIDPLQTSFTAEQYSQLNDLISIVKQKPEMRLLFTQYLNTMDAMNEFLLYKTKAAYLNTMQSSEEKGEFSFEEIMAVDNKNEEFIAYVDTLIAQQKTVALDAPLQTKINSLYSLETVNIEFNQLLNERNNLLRNYMMTTGGIPLRNLEIKNAPADTLSNYSSKPLYKIKMTLLGADPSEN